MAKQFTFRNMKKRRSFLIKMLSDLSKNGWENAHEADWKPLEDELAILEREKK